MSKQGQAQTSLMGSTKTEPKSNAVNIATVADIGLAHIRGGSTQLYEGRGLEAPMVGTDIHECGSQGKHK